MKKPICALALILTASVLLAANNPIPGGGGPPLSVITNIVESYLSTNGISEERANTIAQGVSTTNDVAASNAYTKRVLGSANVWTNGQTFQPLTPMQAGTFRRATAGQTNNILEVQAQDNTPLMWVTKDGAIYQNGTNIFDLLGSGTGSVDTNSAIAFASDVSSDGTIRASGYETTGTNAGRLDIKGAGGTSTNISLKGDDGSITASGIISGNGSGLTNLPPSAITYTAQSAAAASGTNWTLLSTVGDTFIDGSGGVALTAFVGYSASRVDYWNLCITNLGASPKAISFGATTNAWHWSYGQTAPSVLTNGTQLLIQARQVGTNILAAAAFFPCP